MNQMQVIEASNLGGCIALDKSAADLWLQEIAPCGNVSVYTYADLRRLSWQIVQPILAMGHPAGTRIGIIADNCVEYLLAFYGLLQAGYCVVPIARNLKPDAIQYMLQDAEVKAVFAQNDSIETLRAMVHCLPLALDAQKAENDVAVPAIRQQTGDELAMILYTSGSSGRPKGVPISHHNFVWTLAQFANGAGQYIKDLNARVLVAAPLSHMNALFTSELVTAYGGVIVLQKKFDPVQYLEQAAARQCDMITCVPAMITMCLRDRHMAGPLDLSHVSIALIGSAPLTEEIVDNVQQLFPAAQVQNLWGTTECGPAVFGPHPDGLERPKMSIGHPIANVQLRFLGGTENEGELLVKSEGVMRGYINRPDATRESMIDGWYRTGDIMRRDHNGFYFFVSRADDMIVCGGQNMYPSELEERLSKMPAVHQVAVVARDDGIKGEVPVAFIVSVPGSELTAEQVKEFAFQHGPAYQYPREVHFLDEMPLNASRKIDKNQLLSMLGKSGSGLS